MAKCLKKTQEIPGEKTVKKTCWNFPKHLGRIPQEILEGVVGVGVLKNLKKFLKKFLKKSRKNRKTIPEEFPRTIWEKTKSWKNSRKKCSWLPTSRYWSDHRDRERSKRITNARQISKKKSR